MTKEEIAAAPKYLPLGIFFTVWYSNIFTTALLAYCWLDENLSLFETIMMFFAFVGIVTLTLSKPNQKVQEIQEIDESENTAMLW